MNFHVQNRKATQAVGLLLLKSGGKAEYLRISKLIYLADRESILKRGVPIVGGHYYSMQYGPTISEVLTFVGQQNAPGWKRSISPRFGNTLKLLATPELGALAQSEIELLSDTVAKFASLTTGQLVEWCHDHCPEYEAVPAGTKKEISVEQILRAENRPEERIAKLVADAKDIEDLDTLLA